MRADQTDEESEMAIEKSSVIAFAARTVRTREARTLTGILLKAGLLVFLLSPALAQTTDLDALNAAVKSRKVRAITPGC